ncbi:VOC family protein [Burkholderia vietnamiensis]|uniref:VOC family protein n=1 Tax=Burkholderia vietnamiensis TaxID=60552 RepID=UPI001BA3015D|nr:VOC family protein [Burkholderia vietnamiensis]MBR8356269.1 VOC family protein [Burkholderia vietnamiensis]
MTQHLSGIDHFVIAVRDLDAARDDFARMGFALTPRGYHTMGSENHCAMFDGCYLELLTVRRPHPVTAFFSDFLEHGDGAAAMVVATDSADALYRDWHAAGVPAEPPVAFSRPVATSNGTGDASFRITQVDVAYTPGGRVFACEHLTPELVYPPGGALHPNGVTGVAGITIAVDAAALETTVARYERVLAASATRLDEVSHLIRCGKVEVRIDGAARAEALRAGPHFAELAFTVQSLDRLADVLRGAGVEMRRSERGVVVEGAVSHGAMLRFVECAGVRRF